MHKHFTTIIFVLVVGMAAGAQEHELGSCLCQMSLNGSLLYDQGDEMEAYYRGELYGGPKWDEVKYDYSHLNARRSTVKRKDKAFMDIINGLSSPKYSVFKYKNKIYRPQ